MTLSTKVLSGPLDPRAHKRTETQQHAGTEKHPCKHSSRKHFSKKFLHLFFKAFGEKSFACLLHIFLCPFCVRVRLYVCSRFIIWFKHTFAQDLLFGSNRMFHVGSDSWLTKVPVQLVHVFVQLVQTSGSNQSPKKNHKT